MGHLHGWFRIGTTSQCPVSGELQPEQSHQQDWAGGGHWQGTLPVHGFWHAVQWLMVEVTTSIRRRRGGIKACDASPFGSSWRA